MVTKAGWDDMRPIDGAPERGAWLAKDSLGIGFRSEGYLWISYCDTAFLKGLSYAVALMVGADTVTLPFVTNQVSEPSHVP